MEFYLRQFKFYRKLRGGIWLYIYANISHGFWFWIHLKEDENIEYFMSKEPEHHSIEKQEDYTRFTKNRKRIKKYFKDNDYK